MTLHRIKTQVVEVRMKRREGAFALQELLGRLCREEGLRILEAACDRACPPGRHLRIDRIELDLGVLKAASLERDFLQALERVAADVLTVHAAESAPAPASADPFSGATSAAARRGPSGGPRHLGPGLDAAHAPAPASGTSGPMSVPDRAASEEPRLSREEAGIARRLRLLGFFLATGSLPWWADPSIEGDLAAQARALIAKTPAVLARALRSHLAYPERIRRLARRFPDDVLAALAALFLAGGAARNRETFASLAQAWRLPPRSGSSPQSRPAAAFWEAFWSGVALAPFPWQPADAGTHLLATLDPAAVSTEAPPGETGAPFKKRTASASSGGAEWTDILRAWSGRVRLGPPTAPGWDSMAAAQPLPLAAVLPRKRSSRPRTAAEGMESRPGMPPMEEPQPPRPKAVSPRKPLPLPAESASEDALAESVSEDALAEDGAGQGFSIGDAGLVILWPFYSAFLADLGLLKDGAFAGDESRERAVHLLHYLASGSSEAAEWDLPLSKVLCGLSPEAAIAPGARASDREREEIGKLLAAAVGHWSALGSTSTEGFRASFLQRAGMLERGEEAWLLRVERRSYDMLLDRLPWGMGLIKLSWMSRPLQVEW